MFLPEVFSTFTIVLRANTSHSRSKIWRPPLASRRQADLTVFFSERSIILFPHSSFVELKWMSKADLIGTAKTFYEDSAERVFRGFYDKLSLHKPIRVICVKTPIRSVRFSTFFFVTRFTTRRCDSSPFHRFRQAGTQHAPSCSSRLRQLVSVRQKLPSHCRPDRGPMPCPDCRAARVCISPWRVPARPFVHAAKRLRWSRPECRDARDPARKRRLIFVQINRRF